MGSRLFGVVALMPEQRTKVLLDSLRRAAQDSPVELGAELHGQMSALSKATGTAPEPSPVR